VTPGSDTTGSIEKGLANDWNASRNLYLQPELTGCDARLSANSFHPESLSRATGTLTSIPFAIRHDFLTFQLAGGRAACPGILGVNLRVGDEVVRQALPRGEQFVRCTFDVRDLKGREARLGIVDVQRIHGGWIAAGSFAGADCPPDGPVIDGKAPVHRKATAQRTFRCDRRYLNIPATRRFPYAAASGTLELTGSPAKGTVQPVDGKLKLRILIDRCSLDVCAQDGRAFLMHVFQPDWSKPVLAATAEGGRAVVGNLTIHRLKSVWPKGKDRE